MESLSSPGWISDMNKLDDRYSRRIARGKEQVLEGRRKTGNCGCAICLHKKATECKGCWCCDWKKEDMPAR